MTTDQSVKQLFTPASNEDSAVPVSAGVLTTMPEHYHSRSGPLHVYCGVPLSTKTRFPPVTNSLFVKLPIIPCYTTTLNKAVLGQECLIRSP
jgi:hypothetical protein